MSAVTKRRNSAALVICRTAKLNRWGHAVYARRQRVGPLLRQIVEDCDCHTQRPLFLRNWRYGNGPNLGVLGLFGWHRKRKAVAA